MTFSCIPSSFTILCRLKRYDSPSFFSTEGCVSPKIMYKAEGSAFTISGIAFSMTSTPFFLLSSPKVKIVLLPSIPNLCL